MVADDQIRAWTRVGTQTAAQRTYTSVRAALERQSILSEFDADVFLQGSYPNHTNTRGDSDVDIVVMMRRTYRPGLAQLSASEKTNFERYRTTPTKNVSQLRRAVNDALGSYFGSSRVTPRNKCIQIKKTEGYVDADVVPAMQYRLYRRYSNPTSSSYIEGIEIEPLSGPHIVNYPKEHIRNGQTKNSACGDLYKPTVRQVKQLRRWAVDAGLIDKKQAPGYLLECMMYNVPRSEFVNDDVVRLRRTLRWLQRHSPEELAASIIACDEIHYLFKDDPGGHDEHSAEKVVDILCNLL